MATAAFASLAMDVIVTPGGAAVGDAALVEVVERKGTGHPDTICDALAEELSIALARHYVERFGAVLHHNVDKVLLAGGVSRPAFGGGEVVAPMRIFVAGRAVDDVGGAPVPVEELARASSRAWIEGSFRFLDFDRHVELQCLVHPGSTDLRALYDRKRRAGVALANDTSCGVGHAPASTLEKAVLAVERRLNSPEVKERIPAAGEDVKVMGIRRGRALALTVACAQVGRHVADMDGYLANLAALEAEARAAVAAVADAPCEVVVNAADDPAQGKVYLTVTGTSAEAGDDGATGRGNRVGGLITPHRPMTIEAAAGKNPISHVGKLYNVLAGRIAQAVADELPEVAAADVFLVSRIGAPITEPGLVQVAVALHGGGDPAGLRPGITAIARRHIDGAGELWHALVTRTVPLY